MFSFISMFQIRNTWDCWKWNIISSSSEFHLERFYQHAICGKVCYQGLPNLWFFWKFNRGNVWCTQQFYHFLGDFLNFLLLWTMKYCSVKSPRRALNQYTFACRLWKLYFFYWGKLLSCGKNIHLLLFHRICQIASK